MKNDKTITLTPEVLAELKELREFKAALVAKAEAKKLAKKRGDYAFKLRAQFYKKFYEDNTNESNTKDLENYVNSGLKAKNLL